MNYDFQCERRLAELNPEYSQLVRNTALVMTNALDKYSLYFPDFTDHSVLHAMQVINFCNQLIGPQVDMLNEDELYVLLMSCYMHDTGMGISSEDYKLLRDRVSTEEYIREHPYSDVKDIIREFHNEFSGQFIYKYHELFDIPSPEHVEAIVRVSRGHRKTDLYDEYEYPAEFRVPGGNTICIPFLTALIRLADELDIASDRNILLEKLHPDTIDYKKHDAIKRMVISDDAFTLYIETDSCELRDFIENCIQKLRTILDECRNVVNTRTGYTITQRKVISIYRQSH